ncbi:MAG: DUF72 domain-containing protein [Bacteroidetes bacterium]|nr:DUF72 domain-containing protein [Bacteroidota bacterium]
MDYGKVEEKLLDAIDLSLPKDHKQTAEVLSKQKPSAKPLIHVGLAKWGIPQWVGKLYPKKTKATDFLEEYGKQFNCIEFNAIFYKLPDMKQVKLWKSKVNKDFKFCPKFHAGLTHIKRLKDFRIELDKFLEVAHELDNNLGPVFLMPHPQMGEKSLETIQVFLESLPKELDVFTEFRHKEYMDKKLMDAMYPWMQKKKVGSIITDTAGVREGVHMRLTTPEAFIRFVGNSLHKSDYTRIDDWVKRLKQWHEKGLKESYFFMHMHDERYSPELSKYLIEQLNKKCDAGIKVPAFYNDDKKLF